MTGPGPVPQTRPFTLELCWQEPVVPCHEQHAQDGTVQAAGGDRMAVQLTHRRQDMVDPPRAAHGPPPGPGSLNGGGLEHPHEQVQVPCVLKRFGWWTEVRRAAMATSAARRNADLRPRIVSCSGRSRFCSLPV